MWGRRLRALVVSSFEPNHQFSKTNWGTGHATGRKHGCRWIQTVGAESFRSSFVNMNDLKSHPEWESKLYFSFPVWSNAHCGDNSGCETSNNKSSFPGDGTKTIGLLGMLDGQGHPHNTYSQLSRAISSLAQSSYTTLSCFYQQYWLVATCWCLK